MSGNRSGRLQVERWAVVVRLADGSRLYYFQDARHPDGAGVPAERWGRESQAFAYPSEQEAQTVAARMRTNSQAKEYLVVRLPTVQGREASTNRAVRERGGERPAPTQAS
jgi:hypothetical protein